MLNKRGKMWNSGELLCHNCFFILLRGPNDAHMQNLIFLKKLRQDSKMYSKIGQTDPPLLTIFNLSIYSLKLGVNSAFIFSLAVDCCLKLAVFYSFSKIKTSTLFCKQNCLAWTVNDPLLGLSE